MNICSSSKVLITQTVRSKKISLSTVEFGECHSSVESLLGIENEYGTRHVSCQTENTSRIMRWTNTGVHHFAQSALWIQERIHLSAEHDLGSFGPKSLLKQKLQVALLTAYRRVQM